MTELDEKKDTQIADVPEVDAEAIKEFEPGFEPSCEAEPETESETAVPSEVRSRRELDDKSETTKRVWLIVALVAVVLALVGFLYYVGATQHAGHFPSNTTINGIDVSGMTAQRAKKELSDQVADYVLNIHGREGQEMTITAEDVELAYVDNGEVDALLDQYPSYLWLIHMFGTKTLTAEADTAMNDALAEEKIKNLDCFWNYIPMEEAKIVDNGTEFVVQPPQQGTQLDVRRATDAIRTALKDGQTDLNLDEEGLYLKPAGDVDEAKLAETTERLNGYLKSNLTVDFGDDRIVTIDASVIRTWIKEDASGNLDLDRDLAFDFVKQNMAYQYDTFGLKHKVKIHNGMTLELSKGDYGWCLARGDTTDAILEAVRAGQSGPIEPKWLYKGMHLGEDDIGGTYIEISISEQMMWCYKDYELVVETPIVTGNISKEYGTPYGSVWAIDAKKKDAVLGTMETQGYSSRVKYWMPFNGNVGIHDADGWRSQYGGNIYLTSGSHGCVNTPEAAVKQIYDTVSIGTAVVVYDLNDPATVILEQP